MGEYMRLMINFLKEQDGPVPAQEIASFLSEEGYPISRSRVIALIGHINTLYEDFFEGPMIKAIHRKGYCLARDYFTDGQLKFMIDMLTFNQDISHLERNELIDTLMRLSSKLQRERLLITEAPKENRSAAIMHHLSIIMKAIAGCRNVKFMYADYAIKDEHPMEVISSRGNAGRFYDVSPYSILFANNHYYLICHYEGHEEPLTSFRLDRMRHVTTSKGVFHDLRDAYDLDEYARHNFSMFLEGDDIELVIRFDERIRREIISRFGEEMSLKKINTKIYEARIDNVKYTQGLKNYIMMLGAKIEVIKPYALKQDIQTELKKTLALYEEG